MPKEIVICLEELKIYLATLFSDTFLEGVVFEKSQFFCLFDEVTQVYGKVSKT